jgi:hypothetical protein
MASMDRMASGAIILEIAKSHPAQSAKVAKTDSAATVKSPVAALQFVRLLAGAHILPLGQHRHRASTEKLDHFSTRKWVTPSLRSTTQRQKDGTALGRNRTRYVDRTGTGG